MRSHKGPALGLAISNSQKISQPCHPEYNQLRPPCLGWDSWALGLSLLLVVTPWTVELLLGEVVSDVWQIPDSVQPIWATGSPGHLKQLGAA